MAISAKSRERRILGIAFGSATAGTIIGVLALAAYAFRASPAMVPNAALGVTVAGLGLLARLFAGPPSVGRPGGSAWRIASVTAAAIVIALALASRPLSQTTFGLACIGGAVAALNWRAWAVRSLGHALALI